MKITRRDFLKTSAIVGAGMALPLKFGVRNAFAAANSPQLTKWAQAMRVLDASGIPVMSSGIPDPFLQDTFHYQLTAGEFQDQLHPQLGPTTLWGYSDTTTGVQETPWRCNNRIPEHADSSQGHKYFTTQAHHSCG